MPRPWTDYLQSWAAWTGLTVVSLGLLLVSMLVVPWYLKRLRPDYLLVPDESAPKCRTWVDYLLRILSNLLGVIMLVTGIAMLALPGPGLLTIVVALCVLQYPGKHWLLRHVLGMRAILFAVNALRKRANVEPLICPPAKRSEP